MKIPPTQETRVQLTQDSVCISNLTQKQAFQVTAHAYSNIHE